MAGNGCQVGRVVGQDGESRGGIKVGGFAPGKELSAVLAARGEQVPERKPLRLMFYEVEDFVPMRLSAFRHMSVVSNHFLNQDLSHLVTGHM